MIEVTVEVHSIRAIQEQAAKAFAAGEPDTANPYRFGSTGRRVWMLHYDKCERQARRPAAIAGAETPTPKEGA